MPPKRARTSNKSSTVPRKVLKTGRRRSLKDEKGKLSTELDYFDSVKPKPLVFVPTPEIEPFPLERLPTELRIQIYRHHLTVPGMVKPMRVNKNLNCWTKHVKSCPFHQHEMIKWTKGDKRDGDAIECKSPSDKRMEIPIPHPVLVLLLTSRSVYQEALPLYYRHNHFVFSGGSSTPLYSFLKAIPTRRRYIEEVSIEYDSRRAIEGFNLLAESKALSKLNLNVCLGRLDWMSRSAIFFHHPPMHDEDFRHAVGYAELSKLRGLKVVNITGTDRLWVRGTVGIASHVHHVDINSKDAAGPELKKLLMQPRPVGKEDSSDEEPGDQKGKDTQASPRKSSGRTKTEEDEDSTYVP